MHLEEGAANASYKRVVTSGVGVGAAAAVQKYSQVALWSTNRSRDF